MVARACLRRRAARGTQHAAWTPQKTVNPLATRCVGVGSAVCSPPAKHTQPAPRSSAHAAQLNQPLPGHTPPRPLRQQVCRRLCAQTATVSSGGSMARRRLHPQSRDAPPNHTLHIHTYRRFFYAHHHPPHCSHSERRQVSASPTFDTAAQIPAKKNQACLSRPILISSRHAAPNALRGSSRLRRA